jgi:tRNA isopentenyl-2-thiomethyl-A-37 hydroxylase MiaE
MVEEPAAPSGNRRLPSAFVPIFLLAAAGFIEAHPARCEIIDRIAATIDREVITLSRVEQIIDTRLIPRNAGESEAAYRKRVLDTMIEQTLRYRDVQRFGAEDVTKEAIEARRLEVEKRFDSPATYLAALGNAELTEDELRAQIRIQLQVEAYISERFSPLVFVSLEEIENYYNTTWLPQRRRKSLPDHSLAEATDEIRTILKASRLEEEIQKWSTELRGRANVDIYVYK